MHHHLRSTESVASSAGAGGLSIDVLSSPAAIEAEWRHLAERCAASVYQHPGWTDAWLATIASAQRLQPAILSVRLDSRVIAILPLGVETDGLTRVARYPGGEHANIRMPLFDPDFSPVLADAERLGTLLVTALAAAPFRVDLVDLDALPLSWNGHAVPFANHPAARPARLPIGRLDLKEDMAATLGKERRAKRAKKHRAQVNALKPVGGYRLLRAPDAHAAHELFARFRAIKSDWFARMGIADAFAARGVTAFFERLIEHRWRQGEPLLDLHAVAFDDGVHAILGGGEASGRLSFYFLATADDDWRRISPGELLLHDVIATACADGKRALDLGRGDDRYKWSWLQEREAQMRLTLPVTPFGRMALTAIRLADRAEAAIRSNETAFRLAKSIRRRVAGSERAED